MQRALGVGLTMVCLDWHKQSMTRHFGVEKSECLRPGSDASIFIELLSCLPVGTIRLLDHLGESSG